MRCIFTFAMAALIAAATDTFPLTEMQFQTSDPFLFCAYHWDHYPPADPKTHGVPSNMLQGRDIGQDFSQRDGWSMYHGLTVPGFPAHPHRGFETITVVIRGTVDHADSAGNSVRYGDGDVQWMTAGRGLQHSEMFPLLKTSGNNDLELFQLWLNLPRKSKMVKPEYVVFPSMDIARVPLGACGALTAIAGTYRDVAPTRTPPRNSWAYEDANDVGVWLLDITGPCDVVLPGPRFAETRRTLYLYNNDGIAWINSTKLVGKRGARLATPGDVRLVTSAAAKLLVLQGRPINEPVSQRGPMVMNTQGEVQEAFLEFQRTQFGGWPWGRHDMILDGAPIANRDEL
jgi:quercetin 2,3-dioxygenase